MSDASRPIKDRRRGRRPGLREERHQVRGVPGRQRRPRGRREQGERLGQLPDRRAAQEDLGAAAEGTVTNWNQVDPSFPDETLKLFGPGTDSGTFDFFTDAINGEEGASRTDYTPTEDDNVTVQGVVRRQGRPRLLRPLLLRAEQGQAQGRRGRQRRRLRRAEHRRRSRTARTRRSSRPLFIYPNAGSWPGPRASPSWSSTSRTQTRSRAKALFVPLTAEQQQSRRRGRRLGEGRHDHVDLSRGDRRPQPRRRSSSPGRATGGPGDLRGRTRYGERVIVGLLAACALVSVVDHGRDRRRR